MGTTPCPGTGVLNMVRVSVDSGTNEGKRG
jgi:hypothetical protein